MHCRSYLVNQFYDMKLLLYCCTIYNGLVVGGMSACAFSGKYIFNKDQYEAVFSVLSSRFGSICSGKSYASDQSSMKGKLQSLYKLQANDEATKNKIRQDIRRYLDKQLENDLSIDNLHQQQTTWIRVLPSSKLFFTIVVAQLCL